MLARDFPCKTCNHAAAKHYTNIADGSGVCTGCTDYERVEYTNEQFHDFIGDNLKYMELQKKKQEILDEQA